MPSDAYPLTAIDPNQPSAARINDAILGGRHHFAADRAVVQRAVELVPVLPAVMRANRDFLLSAVRFAVSRGIRQFLDLGCGIPADRTVHELVQDLVPQGRVCYVDLDSAAVLHARAAVGDDPATVVLPGDLQQPDAFLLDPQLRAVLDFTEPVCILLAAVLHFVPDSPELTAAMRRYHQVAAPGSLLAVTHATGGERPDEVERVTDLYNRTGTPMVLRDEAELAVLIDGWEPLVPGADGGPAWIGELADAMLLAVVATKR
ncbi:SAM-dependent methyltransferase [Actinoplanes sp. NPDC051859]|uniref:SAM-dependent methyltransferase n=1 Tax=Actinoplanes sp. NPDC051859 TaxID=3363909 RepID=UPI0037923F30